MAEDTGDGTVSSEKKREMSWEDLRDYLQVESPESLQRYLCTEMFLEPLSEFHEATKKMRAAHGKADRAPTLSQVISYIAANEKRGSQKYTARKPKKAKWDVTDHHAYLVLHATENAYKNMDGILFNKSFEDGTAWKERNARYAAMYNCLQKVKTQLMNSRRDTLMRRALDAYNNELDARERGEEVSDGEDIWRKVKPKNTRSGKQAVDKKTASKQTRYALTGNAATHTITQASKPHQPAESDSEMAIDEVAKDTDNAATPTIVQALQPH